MTLPHFVPLWHLDSNINCNILSYLHLWQFIAIQCQKKSSVIERFSISNLEWQHILRRENSFQISSLKDLNWILRLKMTWLYYFLWDIVSQISWVRQYIKTDTVLLFYLFLLHKLCSLHHTFMCIVKNSFIEKYIGNSIPRLFMTYKVGITNTYIQI